MNSSTVNLIATDPPRCQPKAVIFNATTHWIPCRRSMFQDRWSWPDHIQPVAWTTGLPLIRSTPSSPGPGEPGLHPRTQAERNPWTAWYHWMVLPQVDDQDEQVVPRSTACPSTSSCAGGTQQRRQCGPYRLGYLEPGAGQSLPECAGSSRRTWVSSSTHMLWVGVMRARAKPWGRATWAGPAAARLWASPGIRRWLWNWATRFSRRSMMAGLTMNAQSAGSAVL